MIDLNSYAVRGKKEILAYNKIILFGAGSYLLESIKAFGNKNIMAILDNDSKKWGQSIDGIEVEEPKKFFEREKNGNFAIVMSTSGFQYEIAVSLVKNYQISNNQIFSLCSDDQEEKMYNVNDILANLQLIEKVYELLEDEESKEYFVNSLIARLTHNPLYLKPNRNMRKACLYSGEQDIKPCPGDYVLDCGAYIGDTAQLFMDMMDNNGKIYCFEPLEGNFKCLKRWAEKMGSSAMVEPFQVAVSNCDGSMHISAEKQVSMRANLVGNKIERNKVSVRKIDSMCDDVIEKVDFIKMDIEGEELNAILGAKNTIAVYKPQMMISIYHKTSHLWEIPLLLKEIVPEYKIYMGHCPNVSFEPELYVGI